MGLFSGMFGKKEEGDDGPVRDVAALTAHLAVPAIHLVKTDAPSLSHFGGAPNLPAGVAWPERNGKKLDFLARLSLPEIHGTLPIDWLPRTGALLFFYDADEQPWGFDPKDRGGSAVLLVPDLPGPAAADAGSGSQVAHRNVSFRRVDVLPTAQRDAVKALGLSSKETDLFYELDETPFGKEPKHQVSGFPAAVQNDSMDLECQLVTNGIYCGDSTGYNDKRVKELEAGAANWRLLLQFDTDDALRVMWGDCGLIYYWVEEQAARNGKFDNAWVILQCF